MERIKVTTRGQGLKTLSLFHTRMRTHNSTTLRKTVLHRTLHYTPPH